MWNFNEEGEPSLKNEQEENNVRIISSDNGQPVTIENKNPFSSHKTLGVIENPSGNYTDEYKNILQKSQTWH